ncbi:MAG TPA: hypothetical protein PK307_07065 [Spirochaetota bacterium]|nr:hypothetical protein [Spirochaetota bacterium]HOC46047.1 hypothetical protein [Syntrophorhabdaceae bacterium]HQL81944.1 hypothetical protein [Spirochaetota bacterium]
MKVNENIVIIIITIAGLLFFFIIFPLLISKGDALLDSSKHVACGNNIQEALQYFNTNMNLPYQIGSEDYKTIFNEGQISKKYDRDGIQYTIFFNIHKENENCFLKFYKRGMSQPSQIQETVGNYGSFLLRNCQCK